MALSGPLAPSGLGIVVDVAAIAVAGIGRQSELRGVTPVGGGFCHFVHPANGLPVRVTGSHMVFGSPVLPAMAVCQAAASACGDRPRWLT